MCLRDFCSVRDMYTVLTEHFIYLNREPVIMTNDMPFHLDLSRDYFGTHLLLIAGSKHLYDSDT